MHVPADFLAAYADGTLSEGLDLIVASHLTYCCGCRGQVARFEAVGGALLAQGDPAEVSRVTLKGALDRLDAPEDKLPLPADPEGCLPYPVRRALGVPVSEIAWGFRLPGLSEYTLKGFQGCAVSLMRGRPGVGIPEHTHEGLEATLVLSGEMRDGQTVYRPGDLSLADDQCEHHPRISGADTCICLIVRTGRMRFTGRFGRALNLFT